MKLTLVVRADLPPGSQACQAAHAARAFHDEHPEVEEAWFRASNTLALLSVPDEPALQRLLNRALDRGIRVSSFREPDLVDQLTAICLEPGKPSRKLCERLPLALRV